MENVKDNTSRGVSDIHVQDGLETPSGVNTNEGETTLTDLAFDFISDVVTLVEVIKNEQLPPHRYIYPLAESLANLIDYCTAPINFPKEDPVKIEQYTVVYQWEELVHDGIKKEPVSFYLMQGDYKTGAEVAEAFIALKKPTTLARRINIIKIVEGREVFDTQKYEEDAINNN